MSWPPQIGELLPRAEDAYGVHEKLVDHSLKAGHPTGTAEGFARVLAVTADDLEYLADALLSGVRTRPVAAFGLRACTASHWEVIVQVGRRSPSFDHRLHRL